MSSQRPHFRIITDPRNPRLLAIASDTVAAQVGGGVPMAGLDAQWIEHRMMESLKKKGEVEWKR